MKKIGVKTCYVKSDTEHPIKAVSVTTDNVYKNAIVYALKSARLQSTLGPNLSVDNIPQDYLDGFMDALDAIEHLVEIVQYQGSVSIGKSLLNTYKTVILKEIYKLQGYEIA